MKFLNLFLKKTTTAKSISMPKRPCKIVTGIISAVAGINNDGGMLETLRHAVRFP